ncbi:DNA-binding HORMA domain-containing protein [Gorgonomyces haynaldii]|nr:DNA-binding HORMA domain-containing protein [Gorgonomyces haynaldii]
MKLTGTQDTISEFFMCALDCILYQRGVYPPEYFKPVKKFGIHCMSSTGEISQYLNEILVQVKEWLSRMDMHRLVLVIVDKQTMESVEKWEFTIEQTQTPGEKVDQQVSALIRQITASVSFLPILEPNSMTFNVLAYTKKNIQVPSKWIDAPKHQISNAQQLQLRSFTTDQNKVGGMVTYKLGEQ